jgi:hypothetical protein
MKPTIIIIFCTCSDCVVMQDPYCAWDKQDQKCKSVKWNAKNMIYQSVSSGVHSSCSAGMMYFKAKFSCI